MTIQELSYNQNQKFLESRVFAWMQRNWQRHAEDGELDTESLAEQAAWEYGCGQEMAERLAEEFKRSLGDE